MTELLPDTPSVYLAAGTATGAGTSVALIEACRTLSTQVRDGRVARATVQLPDGAAAAAAAAEGLSLLQTGRLGALSAEVAPRAVCDIYIGFTDRLPVVSNSKQFRVMVVQNPHLYESSDAPSLGTLGRKVRTLWARYSATRADLVVCSTEASRKALLAAIPGVEAERVVVRSIRPATSASTEDVTSTMQQILLLGDLYAYKRFDVALDGITTWVRARSGVETIRVVHCGSPQDEQGSSDFDAAVARARSAGVVVDVRGAVDHDEAMQVLAHSDVLLSASEVETQGLTIIEALAIGVPVVARGIAPVIDVAGDAVVAFSVDGGAQEIASSLRGIESQSVRRELVARGRERVQAPAGWNLLPDR